MDTQHPNLTNYSTDQSISVKAKFLFIAGYILFAVLAYSISYLFGLKGCSQLEEFLNQTNTLLFQRIHNKTNFEGIQTLIAQCYWLNTYASSHQHLGEVYYIFFFTFSQCLVIFSSLTTIIVFFMLKDGWEKASWYLKTAFAFTIFFSSLFYMLPNVLKNEENMTNNAKLMSAYQAQIIETVQMIDSTQVSQNIDSVRIQKQIRKNNEFARAHLDLYFSIDKSSIPNPAEAMQK